MENTVLDSPFPDCLLFKPLDMKKTTFYWIIIISSFILMAGWRGNNDFVPLEDEMSVSFLLKELGDSTILTKVPKIHLEGVSAQKGKEIIENGFTEKPGGGKSGKQSSHFVCTSCHNTAQEDPDLLINDPEARLLYTSEHNMPFLQATTLKGAVNRETYYNGDYYKKYGDLVYAARNDIRGAIQLCATECAQGRALDEWELESILVYLWEIDHKIGELDLSDAQKSTIEIAIDKKSNQESAIEILKSKYLLQSDATFVLPPDDRSVGYAEAGRPNLGKLIYENSCLHCHYHQRYSFMNLDKGKLSFKHLKSKVESWSRHSIYQVIRWGVPTKSGKNSYMPQYTKEKLTDQMVEDLRAYIEQEAG